MRQIAVDGVTISDDSDCYVISEIGHNHQGDVEKCKALFRASKESGVHAVKLQKRSNRTLYTRAMYDQPYNSENAFGATYGEHREFLEFDRDEYVELKAYAKEIGITFFATAFDFESADFLAALDMPAYKIASGDLKSIPLIKHVAAFGKPMFISTGGAAMEDVRRAYDAVMPINSQICIMQCTASYPCDFDKLNLRVIETFRQAFPEIVVGLSSHDNGYTMGLIAYMLGARAIEKHFTINRASKGTDHAFSLESGGLRRLVRDLKRARIALGDGVKRPFDEERAPLTKMGKKLVAARDLPAGYKLTRADIALKSPGDGVPAYELDSFISRTTKVALAADDNITPENVQA